MKSVTDGMTDSLKTEYPPYFVCGGIKSSVNPNLDLVDIDAYAKFGQILLIHSQAI